MRLKRALEEFVVEGMKTTIPLHQRIIRDEAFLSRRLYDQVAREMARGEPGLGSVHWLILMLAAHLLAPGARRTIPGFVVKLAAEPDRGR